VWKREHVRLLRAARARSANQYVRSGIESAEHSALYRIAHQLTLSRVMTLLISPLMPQDREQWEVLARGYKAFYETEVPATQYDAAWRRLVERDGVLGLGARLEGDLVGIAHYLFHTSVWAPTFCYLQDLFVSPETRGKGVGRALIEAVAASAREAGAARYYWLTHERNTAARALYDKVARFNGFVRYEFPLDCRAENCSSLLPAPHAP
jgi:GNAT superfamily N-acetyltransferase